METAKKSPSSPIHYSPELAERICDLRSEGFSLAKISRMDGMPIRRTLHRWLTEHADFRLMYAKSREEWADDTFEELRDIINEALEQPASMCNAYKLKVDTLKWILAKMTPRKYGDQGFQKDLQEAYEADQPHLRLVTNWDNKTTDELVRYIRSARQA